MRGKEGKLRGPSMRETVKVCGGEGCASILEGAHLKSALKVKLDSTRSHLADWCCEWERKIEVVGRNGFPHETSCVFIGRISCCKYSPNARFPYLSFCVFLLCVFFFLSHRSWWRERGSGRETELERGRGKAHNAVMPISEISRTLSDLTRWQKPLRDYNENVWQDSGCVCVCCISV